MTSIEKINKTNISTYNKLAPEYEERTSTLYDITEHAVSLFIKHLETGKNILDTGCAVGLALNLMEKKGLTVTGIDISPKMLNYARKRNPKSSIILGDFLTYKFEKKFDGIFSFAFIHLFPKTQAIGLLKRMFLLLNPHGVMYIGTSKSSESKEGWEQKVDYKHSLKRFRKHWTQEELEKTLKEVGFEVVDIYILTDPLGKTWMDFVVRKH